jgi:4-hydroxy-tetrahydrodipicolinate synthase
MSTRLPSGVLAASLTPFHADLTLAQDAFARHVRWLLAHGCDGALLFGTTGEGLSLTVEERVKGLNALLAADLPAERLLVGTGALALPDAVQLTRKATAQGVGGVLVLPPFHFRQIRSEGIFRFYDQLIQRVGDDALRLYFYHFPELSGVPIPFSVIQRLRDAYSEQIAGIKDSSGEWDHTEALCRDFPNLQVFSGTERLLLPVLNAGGAGCISATANVTAAQAAQVLADWQDDTDPEPAQEELTTLRTAFAPVPTIPALKHLLAQRHRNPDWSTTRPPVAPLTEEEKTTVNEIADRLRESVDLPGSAR